MRLNDETMESYGAAAGHYGFSATRIDLLGASEYTLVGICVDVSGSVGIFAADIERTIKEIVAACRKSPRADNLMLRIVLFNNRVIEHHGFKPLQDCAPDDYTGCIQPHGATACFDAAEAAVRSVVDYGEALTKQDFSVNAIVFVITDGEDNQSTLTPAEVKKQVERATRGEALESLATILIGVGPQGTVFSKYLADLKTQAGFTQEVMIGDADAKSLAKLAAFVSRSISAQSQALGTGGPSKALTF